MDELEFRRRVLANPFELDDELIRFAKQSTSRQQFIKSAQCFDKNIRDAVDVSIPEDLAVRVILKQTMQRQASAYQKKSVKTNYKPWYIAGFTTLIAIISLAYAIYTVSFNNRLSEHAVAHMLHEPSALQADESYTLEDVNSMLSRIGGEIDNLPGKVTYLRYCDFDGEQSVHMVFHTKVGPITVLFIPSQFSTPFTPSSYKFKHHTINGRIYSYANTKQVFMSANATLIARQHSKFAQTLSW